MSANQSGHLTCKIVSEVTYNVSSGALNATIPYSYPRDKHQSSDAVYWRAGGLNECEAHLNTPARVSECIDHLRCP